MGINFIVKIVLINNEWIDKKMLRVLPFSILYNLGFCEISNFWLNVYFNHINIIPLTIL